MDVKTRLHNSELQLGVVQKIRNFFNGFMEEIQYFLYVLTTERGTVVQVFKNGVDFLV